MKKFILFLALLVLIPVLVLAYLGFVPYLSSLFGFSRPKDLGVRYKVSDMDSYNQKANFTVEKSKNVNSALGVDFSGEVELKQVFTKEEVSAKINYAPWKYMPIKNVQVNFPEDGVIEFSANLLTSKLTSFLSAVGFSGVSQSDIEKGLGYLKYVGEPPIYAKARTSVANNQVDVNLISVQVGKFSVPFESYEGNKIVETVAEKIFSLVPGFYAESVKFSPSGMSFEGRAPAKGIVAE